MGCCYAPRILGRGFPLVLHLKMDLKDKLAAWQEAGLLDAASAARIVAYEAERPTRPYALYAISSLGALSVAIGILSIVAANWERIDAWFKLALDLALLVGLAAAIFLSDRRERNAQAGHASTFLFREILIFIYYGTVLASIGLLGQIYQLGGELRHALLLWSLVTLPIVAYGRTRFLMATWLIALQTTAIVNLVGWIGTHGREREFAMLTGIVTLPILLFALALVPALRRRRPALCEVAIGLGACEWLLLATVSQLAWYENGEYRHIDMACVYVLVPQLLSLVVAALLPRDVLPARGRRGLQLLLVLGPLLGFLPLLTNHPKSGLLAAIGFIALWALTGFTALSLQVLVLFNLATAFIALRILAIYLELFGGLLKTGLGLLIGGMLTLFLAWLWTKLRRVRKPTKEESPSTEGTKKADSEMGTPTQSPNKQESQDAAQAE